MKYSMEEKIRAVETYLNSPEASYDTVAATFGASDISLRNWCRNDEVLGYVSKRMGKPIPEIKRMVTQGGRETLKATQRRARAYFSY